jgi:hypothetical protein
MEGPPISNGPDMMILPTGAEFIGTLPIDLARSPIDLEPQRRSFPLNKENCVNVNVGKLANTAI